jgi:hypothetical protein
MGLLATITCPEPRSIVLVSCARRWLLYRSTRKRNPYDPRASWKKYAIIVLANLPDDYESRKRIISSAIARAVNDTIESKQIAFRGIVASLTQNAIFPSDVAYALSIAQDEVKTPEVAIPVVVAAEEIRAKLRVT